MLQTSTALANSSIAFTINILGWHRVPALPTRVRAHLPWRGKSRSRRSTVLGEQGRPRGGHDISPSPSSCEQPRSPPARGSSQRRAVGVEGGEEVRGATLPVALEGPAAAASARAGSGPRPPPALPPACKGAGGAGGGGEVAQPKLWCQSGAACACCQLPAPPPTAWQGPGLMARDLKGSKCGGYIAEPPPSIMRRSLLSNTLHAGLISHLI